MTAGGEQSNHAGGAYASGLLRALGSRSVFNALSRGENRRLLGQRPHVRQPDLPHRRGCPSLRPRTAYSRRPAIIGGLLPPNNFPRGAREMD